MNLNSHLFELRKKHETLSAEIDIEQQRPAGNGLHISDLKRKKLHLKQEIVRISEQV